VTVSVRSRPRPCFLIAVLFATLCVLLLLSLTLGRHPVSIPEIVRILFTTSPFHATGSYATPTWVVVEIVRIPRILIVTLCGMGLALSGAAMQGVFRNPLVGPEIVSVSAGASFGGVLAIILSLPMFGVVGLAFGFGMLALAIAFGLARLSGKGSMLALVLSGVIVGTFFGALVGLLEILAESFNET
jgi:iron complex transport system permease protein